MTGQFLHVLIVDDEPLARKGLRKLLSKERDVSIAGESSDGIEAVDQIQEKKPDIVFLDIQMPGLDGFGVIDAIGAKKMPATVFVTAYDLHAMRAFDVHAIDYLLKPIKADRLAIAVDRARKIVRETDRTGLDRNIAALLRDMKPPGGKLERIIVRSIGKIEIVPVADIDWISAEGDYVELHTARKKHLLREKISSLEAQLDASQFIRIHRSTIIRIQRIRELRPLVNGDHIVILESGQQLALSRTMREQVFAALQLRR